MRRACGNEESCSTKVSSNDRCLYPLVLQRRIGGSPASGEPQAPPQHLAKAGASEHHTSNGFSIDMSKAANAPGTHSQHHVARHRPKVNPGKSAYQANAGFALERSPPAKGASSRKAEAVTKHDARKEPCRHQGVAGQGPTGIIDRRSRRMVLRYFCDQMRGM